MDSDNSRPSDSQDKAAPNPVSKLDVNSIYPTPTSTTNDYQQQPIIPQTEKQDDLTRESTSHRVLKLAIIIIGIYIVGSAGWSLVQFSILLLQGNSDISHEGIALAGRMVLPVLSIILGLGIIFRKELARVIYVIVVVVSVLLSLASLPTSISYYSTHANTQSQSTCNSAKSCQEAQNSQRATGQVNLPANFYLLIAVGLLVNGILLIFFTNRRVKRLFH